MSYQCNTTTQPAYISSSASSVRVAAEAGESAKNKKHLAAVVKVEAYFIPLVVETFGIWTPANFMHQCRLNYLLPHHSGVPTKLARKNLLQ